MAEGQEQLRGELGLVAERLDALERSQSKLAGESRTALAELDRRPGPSRTPLHLSVAAVVLAAAALVVSLLL
jgi:hypothetical protein